MSSLFVIGAAATFALLPGCWITFALPRGTVPFGARLALALGLSPAVLFVQVLALRPVGLAFEDLAVLLLVLNLLAGACVWWRRAECTRPGRRGLGIAVIAGLVPAAFLLGPPALQPHESLFWGHGWMHTDVVHALVNDRIPPDEPELAGVTVSYPWSGHVLQALVSHAAGSAPVRSFLFINLLLLAATLWLTAEITGELGGGPWARAAAATGLCFGVNFVGYTAQQIVPTDFAETWRVWGDWRFTPWLWPFRFLSQGTVAIALTAGLLWLCVRAWKTYEVVPSWLAWLMFALLAGAALIYPVLTPAALAIAAALPVAMHVAGRRPWRQRKVMLRLAGAIGGGAAVLLLFVKLVTAERGGGSMIEISRITFMGRKGIGAILATLPLTLCAAPLLWRRWKTHRGTMTVLALGAAAALVLHVVPHIPHWKNEYKFMYVLALTLAPFFGLALERPLERLGRAAPWVFVLGTVALGWPMLHKSSLVEVRDAPPVKVVGYDLVLDDALGELCTAIGNHAALDAFVVAPDVPVHLPALARRPLYAPTNMTTPRPGVNLNSTQILIDVRGYGRQLVDDRRRVLADVYGADDERRDSALATLRQLGRPIVIVVDTITQPTTLQWVDEQPGRMARWERGPWVAVQLRP